jgi:eukaryotic-like serine/threonine-protein kinase
MNDPLIGQQLANFRVESVLGHGGMATVYFGTDVKLKRPVAIKVLDRKYRSDPAYAKRFVNEARMMAQWRHENIVQIYYADEEQNISYYVMEYVDGQDLSSIMDLYIQQKELMPITDVLRIGKAVAGALDYAHRQGVIHRDVKPSNILISKSGRVLLGDFGMALEVRDGSMGSIFGTPHYISPEQAKRSADAVPPSDLYSLGVILFEILVGAVPFNDPSPASIALQHISQPPPPPRSINPLISPAVEAVLLKALEKNPSHRYQSGAKLIDALEDAFKSTGSSPKIPLPPLPVGVPTVRRSESSIEQMALREAPRRDHKVKGGTIHKKISPLPATVHAGNGPRKSRRWIGFLFILLLLGIGGWYAFQNGLPVAVLPSTQTSTPAPLSTATAVPVSPTLVTASATLTETSAPTNTFTPEPSATSTFTPLPTETTVSTEVPTETSTQIPVVDTPTPAPVVAGVPTIKYPNGFRFSFFWNDTSFYMLNNVGEPRSFAAFAFERLDANGLPTDRFTGHRWENGNFTYIPQKLCAAIKIYGDEDPPYLSPIECHNGYAGIVQPRKEQDRALFFWNPKNDGSMQFRILFNKEEVGRCEISALTCEVYIP